MQQTALWERVKNMTTQMDDLPTSASSREDVDERIVAIQVSCICGYL